MPIGGTRLVARRRASRAARPSTCSRASARTASASPSPAIATASGTSGRWTPTARTRSRCRARSAGSSTARPGRRTATTSSRGATSSRRARSAPARSGCSTPRDPTACRSPRRTASRRTPASRRSRPTARYLYYSKDVTPGPAVRIQQGSERHHLRDHPPRSRRPAASGRAVSVQGGSVTPRPSARRQVARLRPPRPTRQPVVRPRPRRPAAIARSSTTSTRICRKRGRSTASTRSTPGRRTASRSSSGARGRSGASTSRPDRGTPIPFTAHVEQTVNEAVRFPQKVFTPEFQVKMLRDVAVSPDGKRVAYGALGHLYVKDLPGGAAEARDERATRSSSTPTWSRRRPVDRLHDVDRRRLRPRARRPAPTAPAAATSSRRPGTTPSRRSRPTARWIVFRDAGRDGTRGPLYGARPRHLRRRRRRSAPPRLVREGGTEPSVRSHRDSASSSTTSRQRQGRARQRRHRRSRLAAVGRRRGRPLPVRQRDADRAVARRQVGRVRRALARVSSRRSRAPDGRSTWARRSSGYPVARISRDAGFNLHWSGDSRRSTGRWGPSSSRATSTRTFTFLDQNLRQARRAGSEGHSNRVHRQERRAGRRRSRSSARADHHGCRRSRSSRTARSSSTAIASARSGRRPRFAFRRAQTRRRRGQDDHARHRRRARTCRRGRGRHPRADQLAASRRTSRSA